MIDGKSTYYVTRLDFPDSQLVVDLIAEAFNASGAIYCLDDKKRVS